MPINGTSIGIHVSHIDYPTVPTPRWSDILEFAVAAEQAGLDSLWVIDHLLMDFDRITRDMDFSGRMFPPDLPPAGVWECWSLLAAIAAATKRMEIGPLVACSGYRNPALQAKIAETIDEISGGRLILGLGAGDIKSEFEMFGYDTWDRRVGRFEEALQIITSLLRTGKSSFQGEFHSTDDCVLRPRGPRPEGLPVMIGALAHRPRMTRLVVEYADIWNNVLYGGVSSAAVAGERMTMINEACEKHGRDPATLRKSIAIGVSWRGRFFSNDEPITGEPAAIAEEIHKISELGYEHIQINTRPKNMETIDLMAPVLAELRL